MILAGWHDDESAAGQRTLLAFGAMIAQVAGRTTVLARWRNKESAVGWRTVLACLSCLLAGATMALALAAIPCLLARQRVGGGANGGARSWTQQRVGSVAEECA